MHHTDRDGAGEQTMFPASQQQQPAGGTASGIFMYG